MCLPLHVRTHIYELFTLCFPTISRADDVDMSASPDFRTSVGGVVGHTDSDGGESEDE